jgi:hypothetical protein
MWMGMYLRFVPPPGTFEGLNEEGEEDHDEWSEPKYGRAFPSVRWHYLT